MAIFHCSGYNYDCKSRNQVVEANADIAGIGVIVGFLATTCLAFLITLAVLFLDRYEKIINFFRRVFTKNKDVYENNEYGPYWRSPTFWSRVLSVNLLSLADTQIMTGLAVQFVALVQHCELSIYHFQIVEELAFLTTVTHLMTVVTLRDYFVKNRWINLPRVWFMAGNLGLLGYTSFISYTYDLAGLDLSSHLACFYQGNRPEFKSAFQTKWAILLIGAIGGHSAVILAMYVFPESPPGVPTTVWAWAKKIGEIFRTWILTPTYAIYGVVTAGQMMATTEALGNPTVRLDGSESEWGFGQFLPVLLLVLPVFAGWESFWEEKHDKDKEVDRFGRRNNRHSKGSNFELLGDVEKTSRQHSVQDTEMSFLTPGASPRVSPRQSIGMSTEYQGYQLVVPTAAADPGEGATHEQQKQPRPLSRFSTFSN